MLFWFFMFIMNLLIPLTMVVCGKMFVKKCPPRHSSGRKEYGVAYGYRTPMSNKNDDTWAFAHQHSGRLWIAIGWALTLISVVAMLFLLRKPFNEVGWYGGLLTLLQCLALVASIFPTEVALRRTFDKNGRRKMPF